VFLFPETIFNGTAPSVVPTVILRGGITYLGLCPTPLTPPDVSPVPETAPLMQDMEGVLTLMPLMAEDPALGPLLHEKDQRRYGGGNNQEHDE